MSSAESRPLPLRVRVVDVAVRTSLVGSARLSRETINPAMIVVQRAVRTQLDAAGERQRAPVEPQRPLAAQDGDVERLAGADGDRARDRLDRQHVARLPVRRRDRQGQPAALPDGVGVGAVVLPDDRSRERVDDGSGP